MEPLPWLERHAVGFGELSQPELDAMFQFTLLWTLFEANCLKTEGSWPAIQALTQKWASQGCLNTASFEGPLRYFRDRYRDQADPKGLFRGLRLQRASQRELVAAVLRGEQRSEAETVGALLLVVYRLRNNLFHGVKWAYGLKGQRENFENANRVLMIALDHPSA